MKIMNYINAIFSVIFNQDEKNLKEEKNYDSRTIQTTRNKK